MVGEWQWLEDERREDEGKESKKKDIQEERVKAEEMGPLLGEARFVFSSWVFPC